MANVAFIGLGRMGFPMAGHLARAGHAVTVFEKNDRIGGLLRYGIPDFKLEKRVIDRRLEQMSAEGVEFRSGVCVGKERPGKGIPNDATTLLPPSKLLAEFDPGAADYIEANAAALRPLFAGEAWLQFEKLVQSYSFGEAQAQLEQALKTFP